MSSESPSTPGLARATKRPRVLVACQRCKTRRQKCDNGSPACGNCARSGAACQYSDRTAYPPSYVKTLEDRVKQLEARLEAARPSHDDAVPSLQNQQPFQSPASTVDALPDEYQGHAPAGSRLVTGMGLLSSCAAAEPHYFGFSAGLSLAHFVQVAIDFGSTSSDVVSLPLLTDRPFSNQALAPHPDRTTPPAPLPSYKTGAEYIYAYLLLIHPLYPFLDQSLLWRLHRLRTRKAGEVAVGGDGGVPPADPMDTALLHLVYAIGSRCLQLLDNQKTKKNTPEGHFLRAMQVIGDGLKFTSIRSIELTLLLAIHSMRSPSGTSVWHLSGLAVRQCIELGLHKQRAVPATNVDLVRADQYKKRLFWSTYIFERKTALVLGRPFALSDEEIDLQLPLNIDQEQIGRGSGTGGNERRTSLSFHRAHIELYQLHTQIRLALYQVKRLPCDTEQIKTTLGRLFGQLDAWKAEVLRTFDASSATAMPAAPIPHGTKATAMATNDGQTASDTGASDSDAVSSSSSSSSNGSAVAAANQPCCFRSVEIEQTELLLEFYKARRSLLQPLMTEGRAVYPFDAADYVACADASGQICQLYRRLHRLSPVPFSLRDLHAIFVAGFTLIYAICSAPHIYSSQRARDIGACSTLLYVITEQWSSAKKYRDAFEVVAEKMEESAARYRQATVGSQNAGMGFAHVHAAVPATAATFHGGNQSASGFHSTPAAGRERRDELSPLVTPRRTAGGGDAGIGGLPYDGSAMAPVDPASVAEHAGSTGTAGPAENAVTGADEPSSLHSPDAVHGLAAGIELDLESDIYGIEGLLYNEGLDWFTGAVYR